MYLLNFLYYRKMLLFFFQDHLILSRFFFHVGIYILPLLKYPFFQLVFIKFENIHKNAKTQPSPKF